jgi:hypothetical protein
LKTESLAFGGWYWQNLIIISQTIDARSLGLRIGDYKERWFTRPTNAFSKKIESHRHMLAISFTHYNFCRIPQTLRVAPATEAGQYRSCLELGRIVDQPF